MKPLNTQLGLSLVELMVGLAVGLFIVATASFALTNQLNGNRRLMLAAQVEQDLRAATSVMTRDLRRSGYWQNASSQLAALGGQSNAYSIVTAPDDSAPGKSVGYAYAQDANDTVDSNDQTGIELDGGILKLLYGGAGWQPLTDPSIVTVTSLKIGMTTQTIALDNYCANPCGTTPDCPPTQQVRNLDIQLTGVAASDNSVSRSLANTIRLRNDRIVDHCGA